MIFASANFGLSYLLEVVGILLFAAFTYKKVWRDGLGSFMPPLRGSLDKKKREIAEALAAGDEARRQTAELLDARKKALVAAESDAVAIVEQAKANAAELVAEGGRRADEDYRRIIQRAEVQIEGSLARVRAEVVAEASQIIVRAVEAVIEAELDGSSHHRLIGEAISATEAEAV